MLLVRPLKKEDLIGFVPLEMQEQDFVDTCDIIMDSIDELNFCVENDGIPVLLCGIKQKWHKVYDSYTLFSKAWKPSFYRQVIKEFRNIINSKGCYVGFDYDRIEHLIKCDRPWSDKMVKAFGFTYVATFRKYINGEDFKLYEVVK